MQAKAKTLLWVCAAVLVIVLRRSRAVGVRSKAVSGGTVYSIVSDSGGVMSTNAGLLKSADFGH